MAAATIAILKSWENFPTGNGVNQTNTNAVNENEMPSAKLEESG